jgi:hypothetical protein
VHPLDNLAVTGSWIDGRFVATLVQDLSVSLD